MNTIQGYTINSKAIVLYYIYKTFIFSGEEEASQSQGIDWKYKLKLCVRLQNCKIELKLKSKYRII